MKVGDKVQEFNPVLLSCYQATVVRADGKYLKLDTGRDYDLVDGKYVLRNPNSLRGYKGATFTIKPIIS
jgi:hypothetical protein